MRTEERVIEVIRKNSEEEVEEISGDSRLEDDLGLDSFARLMIINGIDRPSVV